MATFKALAIAKKIVRIWKEGDDRETQDDEESDKKEKVSVFDRDEDDYDDWGWLHDLLLMLRMCESYTFAKQNDGSSSGAGVGSGESGKKSYGGDMVEVLMLIKTPTHQYDIDISTFQQLHQNFVGQLKERSGLASLN